jgi:hypothetical protein
MKTPNESLIMSKELYDGQPEQANPRALSPSDKLDKMTRKRIRYSQG